MSPAGAQTPNNKGTVLVVDDEKGVLNLISHILKTEGFEVLTAESGYAAFTLLDNRAKTLGDPRITLIISDWVMQGWDGVRLLNEIRARSPKGPQIPFILMSGAVTREQLESAAKNRADSILLKPIKKENLIAKVLEVLERRAR